MNILLLGPAIYKHAFNKIWEDADYIEAQHSLPSDINWKNIDLIIFTGGSDVSPQLYDEEAEKHTYSDLKRDLREKSIFTISEVHKIPKIGICRGGQLLNVLNGGKLKQHVHLHGHPHMIKLVTRFNDIQEEIRVNSTHHQMMIPNESTSELFAYATGVAYTTGSVEPEVIYYPNTQSLCVQYHPELLSSDAPGYLYFQSVVKGLF